MVAGMLGDSGIVLAQVADELVLTTLESTASMTALVRHGVLQRLLHDERTSREALAEDLAASDRISAEADRLELQLHHDHLPTLADEEFIEYDPRTGQVVREMEPDAIRAMLRDERES